MFNNIVRQISQFGINPKMFFYFCKGFPHVLKDYFKIISTNDNKLFPIKNKFFVTSDLYQESWVANGHYFHQDLIVAKRIYLSNPQKHVDISSRVDWFVAHVCVFRDIEVFDIRPLDNKVSGITFRQANLMNLDKQYIEYCDSISCLHAIEHFWLWRYGDPIDPNGHIKWLDNIYKILKKWWIFYFSVPIWPQRIEFNAHRVFSIAYLLSLFENKYDLMNFSYVDDKWDLHQHIELTPDLIAKNCDVVYWCWIFEFKKN